MSAFTNTHWIGTLHLNAIRVLSATITLIVLYAVGRLTGILSGPEWVNVSILSILLLPASLLMVGLMGILTFRFAGAMGIPFMDACAGLMSLMMIVFIAVGDPLIWIVRKYYPMIVPVDRFSFVNPHAVMLVQQV